jgi:hypothetical protein
MLIRRFNSILSDQPATCPKNAIKFFLQPAFEDHSTLQGTHRLQIRQIKMKNIYSPTLTHPLLFVAV